MCAKTDSEMNLTPKYLLVEQKFQEGVNKVGQKCHRLIWSVKLQLVYFKPPFSKDRISKATNQDHQQSDMGISYFIGYAVFA